MSQVRRLAIALGGSTVMVVLIAALVPRAFLINDDTGLIFYLRRSAYVSWISPVLNRSLAALYEQASDVPWYGLYCYALIVATGAVLIHTCLELIDHRPGSGRVATWLGAIMLVASHIILVVGITWTTVSIAALGTAMVAFVGHLLTCQATKTRASWQRALAYGLLFVAGFALREGAIIAMAIALLPMLVWIGIHFVRSRHLSRPLALIAFLAPFAIVVAVQNRIPQFSGAEYEEFNNARGRISDAAAFSSLDKRAPELLEQAGWTLDDYYDFSNWMLTDDTQFSTEKVQRLADTGGVPVSMTLADAYDVLRGIAVHSAASVCLFGCVVVGGLLLAWLDVIDRKRALWFSLGSLVLLLLVPVAMAAVSRFPQRLALQFYTVAAFGMFVVFAYEIARRPPRTNTGLRGMASLLAISLFVLLWARGLLAWADRESWPYRSTVREFASRVNARNGFIMGGIATFDMDPLAADPVGFDTLPGGWGTFTYPWYQYIHRFGIHSGSELLHKMIDNPDIYVIATPYGHAGFEDWLRRRVGNPAVRLALVDRAVGMPDALRLELCRVVTTPLVRGSAEWQLLARDYAASDAGLPGPPDVSGRTFRPITFSVPYEKHISSVHRPASGITVAPVDGGIRCTVSGAETTPCASTADGGDHAGIHIPVDGLGAARLAIRLIDPENILGVYVYAIADNARSIRWRWELDSLARQFGFASELTLVPGYPTHRLELAESTADGREIRGLDVIIAIKPGARAGFELSHVSVSEP